MSTLYSQPSLGLPEKEGEIFIGYGLGYEGGLSFCTGIAKTPTWGKISLRITALNPYSEENRMSSFDLMIGKQFQVLNRSASVSAGVGMIDGEAFELGIPGFDFGIPLELQISQIPSTKSKFDVVLGLNVFGNINQYSPMLGIALIGKLVG